MTFNLSPYYLNTRRIEALAKTNIPVIAQESLNNNSGDRSEAMRLAARIANDILKTGKIPNLTAQVSEVDTEGKRILATIWSVFSFKGISKSLQREKDGKSLIPGSFTSVISLGSHTFEMYGELANEHLYSDTSLQMLSGKRRLLITGMFEFQGSKIQVFPYIIGDMLDNLGEFISMSWAQSVRLYPQQIDAFSKIKDKPHVTAKDLEELALMPEEAVKQAFAAIIGEPFIPKDWGGEKSDLTSSHLSVGGEPLSAAFIFKGPAIRGPLYPANMGKRGDQLVRAFDEPVNLIVVQHCHKIENSVIRQAEALACDPSKPRRYCILDGADTAQIFKAYGKLKGNTVK